MTAGFYSPMPPDRTGVADYSAALLAELQKLGDVRCNARKSDVALYHLGNNQLHKPVYERAMRDPGVIVLHDAVLHHFFLGALDRAQYLAEFTSNYGEWTRELAKRLWESRGRSGSDSTYFRYPMLKNIASKARAVIVHNAAAAALVREHAPEARVHEIPHLFVPPAEPALADVRELRARIGGRLIAGVFGYLRETKRISSILRVVNRLRGEGIDITLVISGEFVSADLERSLARELDCPWIVRTGYLEEAEFWTHAHAVDVCLNLRHPSAGETSGMAVRLMGIGKPVVFTSGAEVSAYPEQTCLRVDPGTAEEEMLASYLRWLAAMPDDGVEIGRHARYYTGTVHDSGRVARLYWQVLAEARD